MRRIFIVFLAVAVMLVAVVVASAQSDAAITIAVQAVPQAATNFRFSGSVIAGGGGDAGASINDFYLDDAAPDDGDAYGDRKSFTVPVGSVYSFSQAAVSGWYVTAIDCTGTGTATVSLAQRSVTIDTSGGDVTCTFRNEKAATITARKHREVNGVLGRQAPEVWLGSWMMQIKTPGGVLVAQAGTNSLGYVNFSVAPGDYQVCEVMKSGWKHWANPANLCQPVTVGAGGSAEVAFGNCLIASCL